MIVGVGMLLMTIKLIMMGISKILKRETSYNATPPKKLEDHATD